MKLILDGKEVYELSEIQKKVIQNDIPQEIFEDDMTRRCQYWLEVPCNKHVHINKEQICNDLRKKGKKDLPVKEELLGREWAEEHPPAVGFEDCDRPIPCKVGDQSFTFSSNHRYILRKMATEADQALSRDEFMSREKKGLEDRMAWILKHKYEQCLKRLKMEWIPKLEQRGVERIPSNEEEFCELVFSQRDYKNRSQRDLENGPE